MIHYRPKTYFDLALYLLLFTESIKLFFSICVFVGIDSRWGIFGLPLLAKNNLTFRLLYSTIAMLEL